jgi:N utilization substance protein A
MEQKRATAAAEEERISQARAGIPEAAFTQDIETLGLPEHVYTILTEAEHRTVGDLMMAMKLNPDSVLSLAGIGPKAMQSIEDALAKVTFPEPEIKVEPVVEAAPAEIPVEMPAETPEVVQEPEEVTPSATEEEPKGAAEAEEVEEEGDEKEFEKIFSLQNVVSTPPSPEDTGEDRTGKKKDKKAKKSRELEFDETRGEVVARKKHKRGDTDLGEDWE